MTETVIYCAVLVLYGCVVFVLLTCKAHHTLHDRPAIIYIFKEIAIVFIGNIIERYLPDLATK